MASASSVSSGESFSDRVFSSVQVNIVVGFLLQLPTAAIRKKERRRRRKAKSQSRLPAENIPKSEAGIMPPPSAPASASPSPLKKRSQAPKMRPTARQKAPQSSEESDGEKGSGGGRKESTPTRKRTRSTIVRKSRLVHGSIGASDSDTDGEQVHESLLRSIMFEL